MLVLCRRQLDFGDGLIAEEVGDPWEGWMRHIDKVLAPERIRIGGSVQA